MNRFLAFIFVVLLYALGAWLTCLSTARCYGAVPPDDPARIVRITIERANGQVEALSNANFVPITPATQPTTQPTTQPATQPATRPAAWFTNATTVNLKSDQTFGPADGAFGVHVASPAGRDVDVVKISPGVTGAVVRNVVGDTSGSKIASVVNVNGSKCTIANVTQVGTGRLMTFSGANGLDADLLVANNGRQSEYGIYAGGDATPNSDCRLRRFDLWVDAGDPLLAGPNGQQHGVRVHNHHNLVLGDERLRLPWMPAWSFYVRDTSPYNGCGITLKEGTNALIQYGRIDGPVGFGPLDVSRAAHPDWKLDGLTIDHCEINAPFNPVLGSGYLHFGWNVVNVIVRDTVVRAVDAPVNGVYDTARLRGSCLRLDSTSRGQFVRVKFEGEKLVDDSNLPNLKNWTFEACTFNAQPLVK